MQRQILNDRIEFRARLICALNAAHIALSPTGIAREFNRRADTTKVSIHSVRKWLAGQAIPTQDKLVVLVDWLNVSGQWLRFGEGPSVAAATAHSRVALPPATLALLDDLARLDLRSRDMVAAMIVLLSKSPREPRPMEHEEAGNH